MKKIIKNETRLLLLLFLALFGFSIGVFDNYRELWMEQNNLSTITISHIISISCIVTVLCLFIFTIKVSSHKLLKSIIVLLITKLITGIILFFLNDTNYYFLIKLIMFFDIAFNQLITASFYPLMMQISKDDVLYTKKNVVESISGKIGFLFVSVLIGKTIFNKVIDYNSCLLFSNIFIILAFLVLKNVSLKNISKEKELFNIQNTLKYFNQNVILYQYLLTDFLGKLIWYIILGMPMLLLINTLNYSSTISSYILLIFGIISNLSALYIVKKFSSKSDHLNFFIKYGIRIILISIIFITNSQIVFIITILYFLLTDCTHNFIFNSYFINNVNDKYALILTTLKYCTSLIGKAMGTFICGLVINLDYRFIVFPALVVALVHYAISTILIRNKKTFLN